MEYSTPGKMNYKIETEAAYYINNEVLDIEQTKNIIQKKKQRFKVNNLLLYHSKRKDTPQKVLKF